MSGSEKSVLPVYVENVISQKKNLGTTFSKRRIRVLIFKRAKNLLWEDLRSQTHYFNFLEAPDCSFDTGINYVLMEIVFYSVFTAIIKNFNPYNIMMVDKN